MLSLREKNRLAAMRETQQVALQLFEERGFDRVTVEEIAERVGMAASTVYRHFGTKEHLVLWDEHETALDKALGKRLGRQAPLAAMRDCFVETLAGRYDAELDFQLRRIRYIYATEQLHAAAVEDDFRAREELTRALKSCLSREHRGAAGLLAGAALLALDLAIDRWQQQRAARPLAELIAESFDDLTAIETIA